MGESSLFFGFEVTAPWLPETPEGRLIDPAHRHLTFLFLGKVEVEELVDQLSQQPPFPLLRSPIGIFDDLLFLPKQRPRVVALSFQQRLSTGEEAIGSFREEWMEWLHHLGYALSDTHLSFLPHVTLARAPFHPKEWKKWFIPSAAFFPAFHLYRSLGHLAYETLWTHPLPLPFEELSHEADLAYLVRGRTWEEVAQHALLALTFRERALLSYWDSLPALSSWEEVVQELNRRIYRADAEEGIDLKAVSYHGKPKVTPEGIAWEMVVDV